MPQRIRGAKVLKAVSSPLRLQTLNLLFDKGPLSYTELMSSLKMNPSRDAGRFAYHLKFLLKADLIEADVEARKYCLTELGKMVIDVADKIDKKAFKPKSMLVRASRFALEEFDANKIANSLIREAKMPAELAQKVGKEAEKQLLQSKTKYLTAPLVREVVNTILIEKGLEEYRHKLTRLGLPVHDVANLIESRGNLAEASSSVHEEAGKAVLKEYVLLNVLPRDIADAHLSGALHINGLSSWVLKTTEVIHDMRFFLQKGVDLEEVDAAQPFFPPPQNMEAALSQTFNVVLHSAKETETGQTLEYFNVFLAPFARGIEPSTIKRLLQTFIENMSQHTDTSLSLELDIPDFLTSKPAFGSAGSQTGNYGDFHAESQLIISLLLEIFSEESARKPLFNPRLVIKIRQETQADERAKALLLKAHDLASGTGAPHFVSLQGKEDRQSVFSASGFRLGLDVSGDWEIDTLRSGCLGIVTVNLPRAVYESGKDKTRFLEILKERLEMASRALEIKHRTLRQHAKGLFPFLTQKGNGDQYFRLEDCSRVINLAGLKEAAEAFCEKNIDDEETLEFAAETVKDIAAFVHKIGRRRGKRLCLATLPSSEASERLAELDIERYGVAKVRFSGTREKPFYSTIRRLALQNGRISQKAIDIERKLSNAHEGGGLVKIELGEKEFKADELLAVTKQLAENSNIGLFAYERKLTYCLNCKKSAFGLLHKCSSCGAVGTLTFFDRFQGA